MNHLRYVSQVSELPQTDHFAILVNNSHYTPADQRSIDHPGHGYPATNDPYVQYIAIETEEDLTSWIEQHANSTKSYKVIKVQTVKIETTLHVKVGA